MPRPCPEEVAKDGGRGREGRGVNGGSKPPAQASVSHCFSLTKYKLKDKVIKNVKTMHSEH